MWWLLLFTFCAFAQDDIHLDLSAIHHLDDELPAFKADSGEYERAYTDDKRNYKSPIKQVSMDEILQSGEGKGAISAGVNIVRIEDNKLFRLSRSTFTRFYRLQDEYGYKYLISKDKVIYKIRGDYVNDTKQDVVLYEPPDIYTPAPNIVLSTFDRNLRILPEAVFYTGLVNGNYFRDLFNDRQARSGQSFQYGAHAFTEWKWPVKVGAVFHYEKADYKLSRGGSIAYSSPSFGPMVKTRDFFDEFPIRFQLQFRVSPMAQAYAQTRDGNGKFSFNSADLLTGAEHPFKNMFGEFCLGAFYQSQWLNLKKQNEAVQVRATNQRNDSFGITISQVFE